MTVGKPKMQRAVLGAMALAIFAFAVPAAARGDDVQQCVDASLPAEFQDDLGQAMAGYNIDEARDNALFATLSEASKQCGAAVGMEAEEQLDFFDYNLGRISRDWLVAELGRHGFKTEVIDDTFDLGAGRTNPPMDGDLDEAKIEALLAAMDMDGIKAATLPDSAWNNFGAYLAATSTMWRAKAKLKP